jgi:hypothetical protein
MFKAAAFKPTSFKPAAFKMIEILTVRHWAVCAWRRRRRF